MQKGENILNLKMSLKIKFIAKNLICLMNINHRWLF